MLACELKIIFGVNLAAQADLQRTAGFEQAFFHCILHGCAVRVRAAEVASPGVAVSIKLNKRHWAEVAMNSSQDGQENGMISAHANGARVSAQYLAKLLGDSPVSIFNGERIDREIAKVSDPQLLEWIDLQHRVPGANHGRLHAHVTRTETRARAVSCAAIEGNADQRHIQL